MNSIVRVSCGVNRVAPANPASCCESLLVCMKELWKGKPDLMVFPRLALCPPSTGTLSGNACLTAQCEDCLDELRAATLEIHSCVLVGLVKELGGIPCDVIAVVENGAVLGCLPCQEQAVSACSPKLLSSNTIFSCGKLRFCIWAGKLDDLAFSLPQLAGTGCDAVILPDYSPSTVESASRTEKQLRVLSELFGIALVYCNGGVGDTSSPYLYQGHTVICECGSILGKGSSGLAELVLTCDLDCDILAACKKKRVPCFPDIALELDEEKKGLLRKVSPAPYLPVTRGECEDYLDRLFELQVSGLIARIANTGLHRLVIGVSGGLDSTLALLVCREALIRLGLEPHNLIAVTMPGFGTSDRTYYNALSLIDALGAQNRDISIKASVLQHFEDIGHDPSVQDVTYENAQARERTQILFDLANTFRGLVVGTGDLSEAALGWCTFGGDQSANYNVNICIPKTVVRKLVSHRAALYQETISNLLYDIVDTPVSPELLPPDKMGRIAQKTEDILGSYELHDFFLYYLVRYHFRPQKLFYYACIAFSSSFTPDVILDRLKVFLTRFFAGQFKRSCSPDAASLTDVNLLSYSLPSDCSPEVFLAELDSLEALPFPVSL